MKTSVSILAGVVLFAAGCDEKKESGSAASPSASAVAVTSSVPSAAAALSAAPSEPSGAASAAPAASSGTSMLTGDAKDVVLTVKDPTKEPDKTIKAQTGGSVTLFLPDYPGTVWSVELNDKTLGKAKEEVIPGFAPGTNGHQFKWTTAGALFKAGQKHKVVLVNKKTADKAAKPSGSFTLTIELT